MTYRPPKIGVRVHFSEYWGQSTFLKPAPKIGVRVHFFMSPTTAITKSLSKDFENSN